MAKIKLTKGELKKQRDSLKQFQRYLPTLQLKKQQLQMEILHQIAALDGERAREEKLAGSISRWAGVLSDPSIDIRPWVKPTNIITSSKNIAGVDLPLFEKCEFAAMDYDLFMTPLWVDRAIEDLRSLVVLRARIETLKKGLETLRYELRITAQRVNLFEKVKIPEAEEAIRLIKIYIGDQMANAVGRSKIAKRKIEAAVEDRYGFELQGAGA